MQRQKQSAIFSFLPQDKQILTQSILKKLQFLIDLYNDDRKIMINIVGFNKQGKSYLCNEFLKVFQQRQQIQLNQEDQFEPAGHINYTRQDLFPSYSEPMTSAKSYYQFSYQLYPKQLYFQIVEKSKQQELQQFKKDKLQLCYENLPKAAKNLDKQKILEENFETFVKIKDEHQNWRKIIKKRKKKNLNDQTKIQFKIKMFKCILQNHPISSFAIICDHPGQNESQLKTISQTSIALSQGSQKSTQSQSMESVYQKKQLKYKQGQIIIYCINHMGGLFTTNHVQNIERLYEQNDPDLVILAFNFLNTINQGRQSILLFYQNIFSIVPQRVLEIIEHILSKKGQEYQNYIKSKKGKLQKMRVQLARYIQFKNKLFKQILGQRLKPTSQIKIIKIQEQKLLIEDKAKIFQFVNRQKLIEYFPYRLFHFYGLSGQKKQNTYTPIKSVQKTYVWLQQNLVKSIISKLKKIHQEVFQKISETLKSANYQIQIKKKEFYLPIQQKKLIQNFYIELESTFQNFKQTFEKKACLVSLNFQLQKKQIKQKLNKLKENQTQESLKNQYRFDILLQDRIQQKIQLFINESTKKIKTILSQFQSSFSGWIKDHLKSLKKHFQIFDKLSLNAPTIEENQPRSSWRLFHKLKQLTKIFISVQNIGNEISNQILQKYVEFMQGQILKKLNQSVEQWNSLIQQIQQSFQGIGFQINLISIAVIQDSLQQTKFSKQISTIILSFFFGLANFFVTKIKSKRSRHYYQKQWKQLVAVIQKANITLCQKQSKCQFIKQIDEQARKELILRSKRVQKIETLNLLGQKVAKIQQIVQDKKNKIFQILSN